MHLFRNADYLTRTPLSLHMRVFQVNITGIAFNSAAGTGRAAGRDTFGFVRYSLEQPPPTRTLNVPDNGARVIALCRYFATCQNDLNTYGGRKEPNYFMGPSLYDATRPGGDHRNLVRHDGGACQAGGECYLLHADMLHEAPRCPGIAHDPEPATAYGAVFWALDAHLGHVVRFDFQQPHGAGNMDHSVVGAITSEGVLSPDPRGVASPRLETTRAPFRVSCSCPLLPQRCYAGWTHQWGYSSVLALSLAPLPPTSLLSVPSAQGIRAALPRGQLHGLVVVVVAAGQ